MAEKSTNEQIEEFAEYIKNSINCQLPARVVSVNTDGTVDIEVIRNDEIQNQKIPHVKIKHTESQKAFIYLGTSSGDEGIVRFFDKSISDYVDGEDGYNYDDRSHNSNDATFELGFIPNPRNYVLPTSNDLIIGTKDGKTLLSFNTGGTITLIGGEISIGGLTSVIVDAPSIKLGESASNKVLTEGSTITDSLGGACTIVSNTTKVSAE